MTGSQPEPSGQRLSCAPEISTSMKELIEKQCPEVFGMWKECCEVDVPKDQKQDISSLLSLSVNSLTIIDCDFVFLLKVYTLSAATN